MAQIISSLLQIEFLVEIPGGSVGKEFASNARNAGDAGLILESGRSPEEGNGNPLQFLKLVLYSI